MRWILAIVFTLVLAVVIAAADAGAGSGIPGALVALATALWAGLDSSNAQRSQSAGRKRWPLVFSTVLLFWPICFPIYLATRDRSTSPWVAVKQVLKPIASLRLTVPLLFMSLLLVYAGTSAQKEMGIWEVQHGYFHSFFCFIPFKYLLPLSEWWWHHASVQLPGGRSISGFPFVGGYTLIGLLLLNLLAAHSVRFKTKRLIPAFALLFTGAATYLVQANGLPRSSSSSFVTIAAVAFLALVTVALAVSAFEKRVGIVMIHFGLILLLVGEVMTSRMANEAVMSLNDGQSQHYAEDIRDVELAVIDPSSADHDTVVVVASSRLKTGDVIHDSRLPFDVRVDAYYPNATVQGPQQVAMSGGKAKALATAGSNARLGLLEEPRHSGVADDSDKTDTPGAFVTPVGNGQPLGTYTLAADSSLAPWAAGQRVDFDGKTYFLQLRFKRVYKPYTIRLLKFTHDQFVGTDMAKNFASRVELIDPSNGVDREVVISMNHPLRYHNDTIYQQKFNRMVGGDEGTVLQVVNNVNWLLPYYAVVIGGLGLAVHFGMTLVTFLRKRAAAEAKAVRPPPPLPRAARGGSSRGKGADAPSDSYTLKPSFPWMKVVPAAVVSLVVLIICSCFTMAVIAKPGGAFDLDAFGKIAVNDAGRTMPMDSLARNYLKVIHSSQQFDLKVGDETKSIPAVKWLADVLAKPDVAGDYQVFRVDNDDVKGILGLKSDQKYFSWNELFIDHPENPEKLQKQYEQARQVQDKDRDAYQAKIMELYGHATTYMRLARGADYLQLYELMTRPDQAKEFEAKGAALEDLDASQRTAQQRKELERYRRLHSALHDLTVPQQIQDEAAKEKDPQKKQELQGEFLEADQQRKQMDLYLAIHPDPAIDLDNRWVGLGQSVLDYRRDGAIQPTATAVFGILADYRDDRAADFNKDVDSYRSTLRHLDRDQFNFRSSFEVFFNRLDPFTICFLLYIGVFLLVCAYAMAGNLGDLARMVYGVICFAMLFSFVGTILGGIWADQSWGRFWGWDPKENGAVMIVLWNALILHARWGGLVRAKGIALLAVFGNIITCWSWFGTNMLGIGLHSYGFMGKACIVLAIVVLLHLVLIGVGFFIPSAAKGPMKVLPVAAEGSVAKALARAALAVLIITFLLQTLGLISRIYISGRPPVTNLYSSAIFIGWGAVALCIGLELVFRNGIGSMAGAIVGIPTLLIADQLSYRDADTMGQLQAVLATNFWLATHVVCVTLGYASTFLAGILSVVFIIGSMIPGSVRSAILGEAPPAPARELEDAVAR